MRKQKILIVLFAGSLVLPGVVWAGFSSRFDMENNENRKLAEFPEVNLGALGDFPEQFEAYYKDRKSTRLNSSHSRRSRMPSSA